MLGLYKLLGGDLKGCIMVIAQLGNPVRFDVKADDIPLLAKFNSKREPDVTQTNNCDFSVHCVNHYAIPFLKGLPGRDNAIGILLNIALGKVEEL